MPPVQGLITGMVKPNEFALVSRVDLPGEKDINSIGEFLAILYIRKGQSEVLQTKGFENEFNPITGSAVYHPG